jgi:ATP-dependent exoDNAse (exonuclease V) beta subunit
MQALDGRRSFIVQAPAGSGKTELLIQRYLTLLATVEEPEQVVAITFTRKAAAEMRGRVLQALRTAGGAGTLTEGHRETTIEIARAVLARDRELGWSLTLQPQRMRVDTLDAMNAWLAQQLPLLSGGVADAELTEDASALYAQAARRTVARVAESGSVGAALQSLLGLVANAVERLEGLLASLLPTRDQWLRHLAVGDEALLRDRVTAGLGALRDDRLHEAHVLIGAARAERLLELAGRAARHASRPSTRELLAVLSFDEPPPRAGPAALQAWQGIAHLLLTGGGQWRRSFTKNEGFGPEHAADKDAITRLRDELQSNEALRETLEGLQYLPDAEYSAEQWHDLLALRIVLLQLVAELRVLFAERRHVDFVELAVAAERALGSVDEPSDLLLAIDRRIQHVLVDEFQDTSHAQFRLLELLTAGWMRGDGRSLFLVGDPMQSIYRFRDADMSLFLKAKHHGVGGIKLESLVLERNFRSAPAVAGWINNVFADIFPDHDREDLGIARFHACVAVRAAAGRQSVAVHALKTEDEAAEIRQVVAILEEERALSKEQSIAILVQSRSHLRGLHTELRTHGLAARAVEIESLAETEIIQDLIGLTRALTHLGDRIAWLAVLHAPWCGIGWQDLHALCAGRPDLTVWEMLHDPERLASLSSDGRARAIAVRTLLDDAQRLRARKSFAQWVEHAWRRLDGPKAVNGTENLDRARQFFDDLGVLAADGDLDDPPTLESFFLQPRRQPDPADEAGIEIMTIHRAKGLEFDTVILLGLGRRVRAPEAAALYWQERLRADGSAALLLAPMTREASRLTDYLQRMEQQRDLAERARLLYVATTRARERLHLVARLRTGQEAPHNGTLLALLWPRIEPEFRRVAPAPAPTAALSVTALPLVRFANGFDALSPTHAERVAGALAPARPEYEWAGHAAVQVGTIVHACLELMADSDLDRWDASAIDALLPRLRRELAMLGVAPRELDGSLQRVRTALDRVVSDPRARWLLASHAEARSEMRLTVITDTGLEHLRLDRTFIDAGGTRWIIDYKTSRHEGGHADAFMDAEVGRYRAQLERYAAAMASIDSRPIRVGLYFPLLAGFRDWVPAASM